MSIAPQNFSASLGGEPAWEIATLYPPQGAWSVDDYLELTDSTRHLVEFVDGRVEVLPLPTIVHQRILGHLFLLVSHFVNQRKLGEVLLAGVRVQIDANTFREPDIVFLGKGRNANMGDRYWSGADWALEIVSEDAKSRERDLVTKRAEYAAAGIGEYWIVDPASQRITVLVLQGAEYQVVGEHAPGSQATSRLLDGLEVDVTAVFEAAKG
jgi:Uma2 family endonuclease